MEEYDECPYVALVGGSYIPHDKVRIVRHRVVSRIIGRCVHHCESFRCLLDVGFGLLAAEAVLAVRKSCPGLRLAVCLPYNKVEDAFGYDDTVRYNRIIEAADEVVRADIDSKDEAVYRALCASLVRGSSMWISYVEGMNIHGLGDLLTDVTGQGKPVMDTYALVDYNMEGVWKRMSR